MKTKSICLTNENKEIELTDLDDLSLTLNDNASLTLKLLNLHEDKNLKFAAKLGQNCSLKVIFADFSKGNIKLVSNVELLESGANCEWHLATLSNSNFTKEFDVSFKHLVGHTSAIMDNYGVARDHSKIVFSGCNHIVNGAKQSITRQNAKIIVFDKESIGVASPILKIDENDVQASHGAVVGQLNSDHMFYLMSRGLSKDEARLLITRGYLAPISRHYSEENKALIEKAIEEAM